MADAASVLMGRTGLSFVTFAVMLSTYGNMSACILNASRIVYALALNSDAPAVFAKLHPDFRTPGLAILAYSFCVWLLAASGTFVWALALSAGSLTILYGSMCACLFKLRRLEPDVQSSRAPVGGILAAAGIAISALLLTRLDTVHFLLMALTALAAAASWWWARRNSEPNSRVIDTLV